MTKVEDIDLTNITDAEFVKQAKEKIGEVQKNDKKLLVKDTFIKIFKYAGDYAKIKSKEIKAAAQTKRCEHFGTDHKKYLAALQATVQEEEKAYEASSVALFDELSISPEMFERSQQLHMQDPSVQMELFNLGIKMEQPAGSAPADLNREKVITLVTESNDYAFELFKKEYTEVM